MLALLPQHEPQAFDVGRIELAVSRRRAFGFDEALALEEPDLGDRDVGEFVAQLIEDVTDRHVRNASPLRYASAVCPSTKLKR